jgi:N,N'-diacetylchitobiose transport system permease protein
VNPKKSVLSRFGTGVAVAVVLAFTLFPAYWMISSAFDKNASSGGRSSSRSRASDCSTASSV